MQRVPEVLQLSIVIERARALSLEPQLSEKRDLVRRGIAAERSVCKKVSKAWFILERGSVLFQRTPTSSAVVDALPPAPVDNDRPAPHLGAKVDISLTFM